MESGEGAVRDRLAYDLCRWAGNELDDAWWDTGFCEDLVNDVVGVGGHRRWLPDYDIAKEGRCYVLSDVSDNNWW